jgi:hypothetical protein
MTVGPADGVPPSVVGMGPLETEVMTILSDEVSGSRFALEPEGFGREDFQTAFRALTPEERDDQFLLSLAGLARAIRVVARAVDGHGGPGAGDSAAG